jgi:hypothetical protein
MELGFLLVHIWHVSLEASFRNVQAGHDHGTKGTAGTPFPFVPLGSAASLSAPINGLSTWLARPLVGPSLGQTRRDERVGFMAVYHRGEHEETTRGNTEKHGETRSNMCVLVLIWRSVPHTPYLTSSTNRFQTTTRALTRCPSIPSPWLHWCCSLPRLAPRLARLPCRGGALRAVPVGPSLPLKRRKKRMKGGQATWPRCVSHMYRAPSNLSSSATLRSVATHAFRGYPAL